MVQCSFRGDVYDRFVSKFNVGDWLYFEDFKVVEQYGSCLATAHRYKIVILYNTKIKENSIVRGEDFYDFVDFKLINDDVIDEVVNVGEFSYCTVFEESDDDSNVGNQDDSDYIQEGSDEEDDVSYDIMDEEYDDIDEETDDEVEYQSDNSDNDDHNEDKYIQDLEEDEENDEMQSSEENIAINSRADDYSINHKISFDLCDFRKKKYIFYSLYANNTQSANSRGVENDGIETKEEDSQIED
ncbi:PREDICTED: glutamic acid-rich protein-like [Camelina sativa]|uniref:Glutamic acid-rich protein-like n=1 Tax=Camelina sativa TaxID=90675 RepID=A0ABM0XRS8_CAMSA|nr:PREDICTED: glutamic acid-rich protein-like [Camelina sativa]